MSSKHCLTRRVFIRTATAGTLATGLSRVHRAASILPSPLPAQPVVIARCRRYDFALVKSTLSAMFDQIGGVRTLVNQKTVTIKVNLTGGWNATTYTLSPVETVYTHPIVVLAACSLFQEYGARRIIICESLYTTMETRAAFQSFGYDVLKLESAVPGLLWEDTHNKGSAGGYKPLPVGQGAYLYGSFQFNHRYVDTDVMVSIPKMKNHLIAGITLSMKNLIGTTPSSLYSSGQDNEATTDARVSVLHEGALSAAGGEVLPVPSVDPGYRVPRAVVDILRARPIDLCIIDGIVTIHGGEGAWHNTRLGIAVPNLLIVGRNPVCTDAVAAAVMGYDPEAAGGTKPFYNGANMLRLAAESGLGTIKLDEIETAGLSIANARYTFQPTYKSGEQRPY